MKILACILLMCSLQSNAAYAIEPKEALEYLTAEPVTLMDLGVDQLAEQAARVASRFRDQFGVTQASAGAAFSGAESRLIVYAGLTGEALEVSEENCAFVHSEFVAGMGRYFGHDKVGIARMLANTFSHSAGGNSGMDEMGEALVEATYFMVSLSDESDESSESSGPNSQIVCEGRVIDEVLEYRDQI